MTTADQSLSWHPSDLERDLVGELLKRFAYIHQVQGVDLELARSLLVGVAYELLHVEVAIDLVEIIARKAFADEETRVNGQLLIRALQLRGNLDAAVELERKVSGLPVDPLEKLLSPLPGRRAK